VRRIEPAPASASEVYPGVDLIGSVDWRTASIGADVVVHFAEIARTTFPR